MVVERDNIGIFGKMNSGKSSIMNLITQQNTSITDITPGTTADTKITLQEIHGMGPVRLYDTAGNDESGELGQKKKEKIFSELKECDLVLLVIDPSTKNLNPEKSIISAARESNKQILIVYNLFDREYKNNIIGIEKKITELQFYRKITLSAIDNSHRQKLLNFIIKNFESKNTRNELLPFIEKDEHYVLNIPMDSETPHGRFLRPQEMCCEYITRNWAYNTAYRMDLIKARNPETMHKEKKRFDNFLSDFKKKPKALITDSQAIDIIKEWVPNDIDITTFSIVMINYFSRGRLKLFINGVKEIPKLKRGDKVLIVEACNHSRIDEDIGTKQIPEQLNKMVPGIIIKHNFGREFQENNNLKQYKLIIHCGGCMISSQKLLARIRDLEILGIPFTNYGMILSYFQGEDVLKRVLKPWNIVSD